MRVTGLEETGKNRFSLYVDNAYFATVDQKICKTFGLAEGVELPAESFTVLLEEALIRKARERALYLLDHQAYTRKQLYDKLIRTNEEPYVQQALDQLEAAGIIDDLTYGRMLAEELMRVKGAGNRKIMDALYQRGVSAEARAVLRTELPDDGAERVALLLSGRLGNRLTENNGEQKVINALLRLGYRFDEIRAGLRLYLAEHTENEPA